MAPRSRRYTAIELRFDLTGVRVNGLVRAECSAAFATAHGLAAPGTKCFGVASYARSYIAERCHMSESDGTGQLKPYRFAGSEIMQSLKLAW